MRNQRRIFLAYDFIINIIGLGVVVEMFRDVLGNGNGCPWEEAWTRIWTGLNTHELSIVSAWLSRSDIQFMMHVSTS